MKEPQGRERGGLSKSARPARRRRGRPPRSVRQGRDLETEAYTLIFQRTPSGLLLADLLGVSIPTVRRLIASLRRKGIDIVSVRRGLETHYEARDGRPWEELEKDPLLSTVIPAERMHGPHGKAEDADYDED